MANRLNQKLDVEIRRDAIKSNIIGLIILVGMISTIVTVLILAT